MHPLMSLKATQQARPASEAEQNIRHALNENGCSCGRTRCVGEKSWPRALLLPTLNFIDNPDCPITLIELTHGTGGDTDWSVDRVNNDGAYAEGNLVVMSTRANTAKGDKSLLDVISLTADGLTLPGLSVREALRMRSVMEGPCRVDDYGAPKATLWTRLCQGSTRTDYQTLQHILLQAA